jgi:hypothetical protein
MNRAVLLIDLFSGPVPLAGITTGYCFAGNAVILGTCDVIIATEDAHIGIGGPAMIEGGGLGAYHPSEIGPMSTHVPNGVVDILVKVMVQSTAGGGGGGAAATTTPPPPPPPDLLHMRFIFFSRTRRRQWKQRKSTCRTFKAQCKSGNVPISAICVMQYQRIVCVCMISTTL